MEVEEIRRRIAELTKEKELLEGNLQEAMISTIQEIGQENPYGIKKASGSGFKMMTISSSQLASKPWSMSFFDWEESTAAILKYLEKTPTTNWKKRLEKLLESKGDVIELKRRGTYWSGMRGIVQKTLIDRVFIEKIIERI
jgi:hypothetical protein